MRLFAIVLLVAGCYEPSLPSAPFTCGDGICPDGYRCEQGLCLAPTEPSPPILIATTSVDSAPPQAVYDGTQFGVFWNQAPDAASGAPASGIHFSTVASNGMVTESLVDGTPNPLTFSALYHAKAQRYVVALAQNNISDSRLILFMLAPSDPTTMVGVKQDQRSASALGFTTPSIAVASDSAVAVAYTFASPPAVDSDNVYCEQYDVMTGNVTANVCTPSPANTNGAFVVEATVAESQTETTLFWRTTDVWETLFSGMTEHPPNKVNGLNRVVRAVYSGDSIGIVGEKASNGMGPRWAVGPAGARSGSASRSFESPDLAPDLVAVDQGFLYCARHSMGDANDGEIEVGQLTTNFDSSGTPTIVPRISRADIVNCHLVLGTTTVGVVWQELVPPASARTYLTAIPIP